MLSSEGLSQDIVETWQSWASPVTDHKASYTWPTYTSELCYNPCVCGLSVSQNCGYVFMLPWESSAEYKTDSPTDAIVISVSLMFLFVLKPQIIILYLIFMILLTWSISVLYDPVTGHSHIHLASIQQWIVGQNMDAHDYSVTGLGHGHPCSGSHFWTIFEL